MLPLLRACFPNLITTTEQVGRAMLAVAKKGTADRILESKAITALAQRAG